MRDLEKDNLFLVDQAFEKNKAGLFKDDIEKTRGIFFETIFEMRVLRNLCYACKKFDFFIRQISFKKNYFLIRKIKVISETRPPDSNNGISKNMSHLDVQFLLIFKIFSFISHKLCRDRGQQV